MPRSSEEVYYLGYDTGKKGGIAIINDSKRVVEYHQYIDNYYDISQVIRAISAKYQNIQAVIEKVWPFPKTKKQTAFSMGGSLAEAQVLLTVFGIPYVLIVGTTWQKSLKLPSRAGGDLDNKEHKERLRAKAQQRFPKCDVWAKPKGVQLAVCDAILIADFCRDTYRGVNN